jgi:hypothetical protein
MILWGALLPALAILPAAPTGGASLLFLGGYALLYWRIQRGCRQRGCSDSEARLYAAFTVLAKFPGALGVIKFSLDRWRGRHPALIEHKQIHTGNRSTGAP